MTTATQLSELPAIEYPDSDGLPMSDNTLQNDWMFKIKGGVSALFRADPDVFVACDLLWYPVQGDPGTRIAPDVMVVFGRPKGRRGSYRQWEEGNLPPHVVFEVLAPGNRPGEMDHKFRFYEQYGVEEYYVYDPDDGSLEGWRRVGNHLEAIPQMAGYVSPRLGIRFDPGKGPDNLRIFRPDGERFVTFDELDEKLKAEEQRADKERQRADEQARVADEERRHAAAERQRAEEEARIATAERQRADEARQRAERLATRLRELGIELD
jgi:Uma2 family endonuclease